MDFGAVLAPSVIDQLVEIVGEGVLRVGALVQLEQDVADRRRSRGARARQRQHDVVLPLHLVTDVVFVPRVGGILERPHLVGVTEGEPVEVGVEIRAGRIPAVLVPEVAAPGAGRRMPRGVGLAVGADHGVGVVLLLGTGVVGPRMPSAEGTARQGVAGIDEIVLGGAGGQGEERQASAVSWSHGSRVGRRLVLAPAPISARRT